jgi:hypothetical protein
MKRVAIAGAVGLAIVGTLTAGTASAAPHGVGISTYPIPDNTGTVYNIGCWTSFSPGAPHGAPMTQFYANCGQNIDWVCPAVTVNGVQTVYTGVAELPGGYDGLADSSDTAVWFYPATIPNGIYTTVFC